LQRVGQEDAQHREHHDAEAGAEVRAVDRSDELEHVQCHQVAPTHGSVARAGAPLDHPRERSLDGQQAARRQDQERHDALEDLG